MRALLQDLDYELQALSVARHFSSVFIGGGTPSLFSGAAIARLLDGVRGRVTLTPDVEITLEANPGSAEAARFSEYAQAGVNRLSLGVQSFSDPALKALGRVHDARQAEAAFHQARAAGFRNINIDLMFGLPAVAADNALADLDTALALAPEHMSWYQLTLEAGTAFARQPPALPSHDAIADIYDLGLKRLAEAGFVHYEISAHAQDGRACRHNRNYWLNGDYLGIGAGAHGKWQRDRSVRRRARIRHPDRYLSLAGGEAALDSDEEVSGARLLTDFMINALRLREGFALSDMERSVGIEACDPLFSGPLARAEQAGWLRCAEGRVIPTERGFRFLTDLQLLFVDVAQD